MKGSMTEDVRNRIKKHVAQAIVLYAESTEGYPEQRIRATEHLSRAAGECEAHCPRLVQSVRRVNDLLLERTIECELSLLLHKVDAYGKHKKRRK